LNFNHWRYKTLHWAFGINPTHPDESKLPNCFYTHYCPLFHLTNLIAIFSPFIIFYKLIMALGKTFSFYFSKIKSFVSEKYSELTPELTEKEKVEELIEFLVFEASSRENIIETVTRCYSSDAVSIDEINKLIDHYMKKYVQHLDMQKENEIKKENYKKQLYFWVNLSTSCGKLILNLVYVALGCLSLYALYNTVLFVYSLPFSYLLDIAKYAFKVIAVFLGLIIGATLFCITFKKILKNSKVEFVFNLIVMWGVALMKFNYDIIENIGEFISTYYENNCPPILLEDRKDDN